MQSEQNQGFITHTRAPSRENRQRSNLRNRNLQAHSSSFEQ